MVTFLNTSRAYAEIDDIIDKADSNLVLISPYIRFPQPLLERLKYKDSLGIKTIVVCRGKNLNVEERSKLKQLKHLELRFDEDVHAKCYYNEKSMVITSLNLYEHSQQYNREMGILLNSEEDPNVFNEALSEAKYIVSRAKKDSVIRSLVGGVVREAKSVAYFPTKDDLRKTKIPIRTKQTGYCIRCERSIAYDLEAPYCPDCYRVWSKYKDPDYEEEYCHWCGKPNEPTTINRPLCYSCYRKSQR